MHGSPYYHGSIKKYVVAFGTVFNELYITKQTKTGTKNIHVPIRYGPKSHYYAALKRHQQESSLKSVDLPQMSYFFSQPTYAAERKLNTLNRYSVDPGVDTRVAVYNPAPYNFDFELSIFSKGSDDSFRVLEQILPAFQPNISLTINTIDEVEIQESVIIRLNGVNPEDNWLEGSETNRLIQWNLQFTLEGWLFPEVREQGIITDVYVDIENNYLDPPVVMSTIHESGNP